MRTPLLLLHRAVALGTGGSIEVMFTYDYLTMAAIGTAGTAVVDRGMWPVAMLAITLAALAVAQPMWTPHLWLLFSLGMPVVAGTAAFRMQRQRRTVQ